MCTSVDHNYGVPVKGIPPLLAVPLAGPVNITIKDLNGKLFGKTTATSQGEWRQTFCLDDGTYIVEFTGAFRPIGVGFKSTYNRPTPSISVTIAVPLNQDINLTPPLVGVGPAGPAGPIGPIGVQGEIGPIGPEGTEGSSGIPGSDGLPGTAGDIGPAGPAGSAGTQGTVGVQGARGDLGPQGSQGIQGSIGPIGPAGAAGTTGVAGSVGATGVGSGGGGSTEIFARVTTQSITAASQPITATDGSPYRLISSDAIYTLTAEPTIAVGRDGELILVKNVGSNNITLQDVNALGSSALRFTANTLTIEPGGTLSLIYDTTLGFWIEQYLLNPQSFTPSISNFTVDSSGALTHEWGDGTTSNDTAPVFVMTYIGAPSAASVTITASPDAGYPLVLSTPFLTDTGAQYFRSATRNGTRTFQVTATVSGTGGLTDTVIVTYRAPNYSGISTQTTNLTSSQVVALTHTLDTNPYDTYSVTAGASDYVWFGFVTGDAVLDSTLYFKISGERAKFALKDNPVSVTSTWLKVQNYDTYRSDLINLGSVSVVVQSSRPPSKRYVGKVGQNTQLSEAQIEALQLSDLVESPNGTFAAITTLGSGDYIWFCVPSVVSAPSHYGLQLDADGGGYQEAAFTAVAVQTVTNQFGFVDAAVKNIHSDVTELQAITINASTGTTWSLKTQAAAFNSRIYMGPAVNGTETISNSQILALDDTVDGQSNLQSTVPGTYSAIKITFGEFLWFCHPDTISDLATIKDQTTGFAIGGQYRNDVSHTDDFGIVTTYRCWRSTNSGIFPASNGVLIT